MSGEIFGLSIDTCIFSQHKNRLETGWFARLSQFYLGTRLLYLPDVVKREVVNHIAADAESAQIAYQLALANVRKTWNLRSELVSEPFSATALEMAMERFKEFEQRTSAKILPVSTDVGNIFDAYFKAEPPFEKQDAKKHEFPDAFALKTLEELCEEKNGSLLVVSADKGWHSYCKNNSRLVCVSNLGEALSCFQDQNALFAARLLSSEFEKGNLSYLQNQVEHLFEQIICNSEFDLDAESSSFRLDYDLLSVKLKSFQIDSNDGHAFSAVDFVADELTLQCTAAVEVEVEFDISFYVWDPEDREEWKLTSEVKKFTSEQRFDILVSFDLPQFRDVIPDKTSVVSVEIKDKTVYVEGGLIEPYFGHPDD